MRTQRGGGALSLSYSLLLSVCLSVFLLCLCVVSSPASSGAVAFNSSGSANATVVNADILSLNAVIHEIDTVLLTSSLEEDVSNEDAAQSTKATAAMALVVTLMTTLVMTMMH